MSAQEADSSIEKESALRLFSLVYEEIYFIDTLCATVDCRTSSSLLREACIPGTSLPYEEAVDRWLSSIDPRDRIEMKAFFEEQGARVGASRYDILQQEFRVPGPSDTALWCEGSFVPLDKDCFLFCCRRIDLRGESRQQEQYALSELKRLMWDVFSGASAFSAMYDFDTRRRIDPDKGSPFTRGVDTSYLDNLKGQLVRCTHPDDLPGEVVDGTVFGELASRRSVQQKVTYGLRMRFENEAYRWYSLTLILLDARAGSPPILCIALCKQSDDKARQLAPAGAGSVMSQSELISWCWGQRDNPERGQKPGCLMILRVDGYSALSFDTKDEAMLLLDAVLAEGRAELGYEVGRMIDGSYLVCSHAVSDRESAEKQAQLIQKRAHEAIGESLGLTVSIGLAPCLHDRARGFKVAYDEANRLLERSSGSKGGIVAFVDPADADPSSEDLADRRPTVFIRTFGFFEVFVDGRPVLFRNEKAKELLALIVDRRGGFVGSRDAVSCLWEEEPINRATLTRHRKAAMFMHRTLEEYGIADIVVNENGRRRIETSRVTCDLYEHLAGSKEPHGRFKGIYMLNYSWGEITLAELLSSRLGL